MATKTATGERMKVYCFDIDGTICSNSPTDGDYRNAVPFKEVIKKINSLYDLGHRIILFTARGTTTGLDWFYVTKKQLRDWRVKYHELIMGKPCADLYIDDRGIQPNEFFGNLLAKDLGAGTCHSEHQDLTSPFLR